MNSCEMTPDDGHRLCKTTGSGIFLWLPNHFFAPKNRLLSRTWVGNNEVFSTHLSLMTFTKKEHFRTWHFLGKCLLFSFLVGIQELSDCKLYKIILWMLAQWPKGMVRCETPCQLVKLLMNTYPPVDRGMHLLELVRVNILQKHQSSTNIWPIPNAFNHKQDRPGDILDNHILNPWMF